MAYAEDMMQRYDLERGGLRVLIVDPAVEIRNLVKAILSLTAHQLLLGHDVEGSLALARAERPDAIIAACGRHEVGTELCQAVRRDPELGNTPFVLLTTSSNLKRYPGLFESGCDEIMPVPFRCKELLSSIERAMRRNHEYGRKQIHVLFKSGETGFVDPRALNRLIADDRLLCFRRRDGVALIGRDPIRTGRRATYSGPERRTLAA